MGTDAHKYPEQQARSLLSPPGVAWLSWQTPQCHHHREQKTRASAQTDQPCLQSEFSEDQAGHTSCLGTTGWPMPATGVGGSPVLCHMQCKWLAAPWPWRVRAHTSLSLCVTDICCFTSLTGPTPAGVRACWGSSHAGVLTAGPCTGPRDGSPSPSTATATHPREVGLHSEWL